MRTRALGILAVALSSVTTARADEVEIAREAARLEPVSDGGVYVGGGGGYLPADGRSPYVTASLALDRPLFWRLGLWATGESSVIARDPEATLALRLCFGVRADLLRNESRSVRLVGTLAFAHQHEAALSVWRDHPLASLFGESSEGLGHRSGVDVGAALLLTPWIDTRTFARRLRMMARLSGEWLPDGRGPSFYVALITSVGVAL